MAEWQQELLRNHTPVFFDGLISTQEVCQAIFDHVMTALFEERAEEIQQQSLQTRPNFDVFISKKSEDFILAKKLYEYLIQKGCKVFLSEESLPNIAGAEYQKEIDSALETSRHLIVVGSSSQNINSSYVESEWRMFINELRSGRKKGNVISLITNNLNPQDLPISLRYYEVIPYQEELFERVYKYLW